MFTMAEMAEAFDIRRVNPNPARFDLKKLEAINAAHMRLLSIEELEQRLVPFLQEADLIEDPPTPEETLKITEGSVLIHERVGTLGEGADMLAFLFLDDVVYDETDVAKVLDEDGLAVVAAAREALGARPRPGTPRPSTRRCAPSSSRSSASSRATPSARCASPSPVAGSRRPCSSRSSCSAARSRWPGSTRLRQPAARRERDGPDVLSPGPARRWPPPAAAAVAALGPVHRRGRRRSTSRRTRRRHRSSGIRRWWPTPTRSRAAIR